MSVAAVSEIDELRRAFESVSTLVVRYGGTDMPPEHGALLVHPDGTVAYAAARMEEMLGVSPGGVAGESLSAVLTRLGLAGFSPESEADGLVTSTRPAADGSSRVLHHHAVALRDPAGHPIGTLYFFRDVSALMERSRELDDARDRLTRAQHLRALGELAAEVAHEFGNLLQAIGLQAAAMHRAPLPEAVGPALHSIKQAVDIGRGLTRRLLTFARDEASEPLERLDVAQVLRDVVRLLEPRIFRHSAGIRLDLSLPALPPIDGSAPKLIEAFLNLFLNALDAMPDGGTLRVSAVERSGELRVAIGDSGTGMTAEQQRRAFDPFFTTKPGGTGLGLSTVYGVVRAHRGSVFLESSPGKGTTVFVSLPTSAPVALRCDPLPLRAIRDPLRILVVDDHAPMREATAELLAIQGYWVESAGTVADALAAMERARFGAVVTDIGLPDRPGWEIARAAKDRSPETIVILVSAWGSHFTREEAHARGADCVLEKPLDPEMLLSALERAAS